MNKHTGKITFSVGSNYDYTMYVPRPHNWGSVYISRPLAAVESIDAKVEQMIEFPEVKALLERVK